MTREKLKLKATENKNPEVPEEVRKGTRVNMDQRLHLDDPWEERRDVGTHLGQSRNQGIFILSTERYLFYISNLINLLLFIRGIGLKVVHSFQIPTTFLLHE